MQRVNLTWVDYHQNIESEFEADQLLVESKRGLNRTFRVVKTTYFNTTVFHKCRICKHMFIDELTNYQLCLKSSEYIHNLDLDCIEFEKICDYCLNIMWEMEKDVILCK